MIFLLLIPFLFLIVLCLKVVRIKTNPLILFLGLWIFILVLNNLKLYDMYDFGDKGNIICIVGMTGYTIGCFFSEILKNKLTIGIRGYYIYNNRFRIDNGEKMDRELSIRPTKMMYAALIIALVFNLFMSIIVLSNLRSNVEYGDIRSMLLANDTENGLFQNSVLSLAYNWVDVPLTYAITPITLYMMTGKQVDKKFIIGGIINIVIFTFATSGRFLLFSVVVQIITLLEWFDFRIPRKTVKILKRIVIIAIIAGVGLSLARIRSETNTSVNSFYGYFSIPVSLLGHWVNVIDNESIRGNGIAFFLGFFTLLNSVTARVGFHLRWYETIVPYISMTQTSWIKVFPNKWYNAFVSLFYYFYLDFGYFGVFIGCFVFAIICCCFYYRARQKKNIRSICLWLLIEQAIITTLIRWQLFGNASFILSIVVLSLLLSNKVVEKEYS